MDWQAFIRGIRKGENGSAEMTLSQIAETVNAPLSTISSLATGDTMEPRASLALRLIRAFPQRTQHA